MIEYIICYIPTLCNIRKTRRDPEYVQKYLKKLKEFGLQYGSPLVYNFYQFLCNITFGIYLIPANCKSSVTFQSVSLVDAGEYKCTATNRLETVSDVGSLIVRSKWF